MSLRKFKLVQAYPGSPEIGYTINSGNSMFYSYKPELYPHLWQEIKCDVQILTNDGVLLGLGESYFIIRDYEYIVEHQVSEYGIECSKHNHETIFSSKQAAEEYLDNSINLELEDGKVLGENILLYGLCLGSFQLAEMNSLKLHKKTHGQKASGHISDKWKWFKLKSNRTEYIIWNKPMYSLNDIKEKLDLSIFTINNIFFEEE